MTSHSLVRNDFGIGQFQKVFALFEQKSIICFHQDPVNDFEQEENKIEINENNEMLSFLFTSFIRPCSL